MRLVAVEQEPEHSFACPSGAASNGCWLAHGAHEAWCRVPGHDVAFTGGHLRPTPRGDAGALGYRAGDWLYAVAGRSRLWWTDSVVTWQDFFTSADTNSPFNVQIVFDNPFVIRVNETAYYFADMYSSTNDNSLVLDVRTPDLVLRGGTPKRLEVVWSSLRDIHGTVTLDQTDGFGKVRFWADAEGIVPSALPIEVDAHAENGITLFVTFASTSAEANDIAFEATLRGELDPADVGVVRSASTTAAEILRLDAWSSVAGDSTNPPPFVAGSANPFSVTNSPSPDRHLVIPFDNVADASLAVSNFSVSFALAVSPTNCPVAVDWTRLAGSPPSGGLVRTGDFAAELRNPSEGGVYRIAATLAGIETVGTVVLPLSGAEMQDVLSDDLARADAFAG